VLLLLPLMLVLVTDMLSTQRQWFQGLLLSGLFVGTGLFFCSALLQAKILLLVFLFAYLFVFFSLPGYRAPFSVVLWLALLSTSTSGGDGWHNGVNLALMVVVSLLIVIALYVPFSRPYRSCLKACLVLYADEITQAWLHLARPPGAPTHTGLTYPETMAHFCAVSLQAGLLIHDRQYLLESERIFAREAAVLHRTLRALATDMSFLQGAHGQRETLLRAAPTTGAVLTDFLRRLENVTAAMRKAALLAGPAETGLYPAWTEEAEGALARRASLGMDCTRVVYGLTCFHHDLCAMEAVLSDPRFWCGWNGKRSKAGGQVRVEDPVAS